MTYQLDNQWHKAQRRLELLCEVGDPQSIEALEATGIGEGWHCLDVGAGLGTLARWMANRVGPTGSVTATDIEPRFLYADPPPALRVLQHDIVRDELPAAAYDLVHVRAVLMHVPEPADVLAKLFRAVRPGGHLVLEEPDFRVDGPDELGVSADKRDLYLDVRDRVLGVLTQRGVNFSLGRTLWGSLTQIGCDRVWGFARTQVVVGGSRQAEFETLTYEQLLGTMDVAAERRRAFLELFSDPEFAFFREMLVTVTGRRAS